MAEDGIRTEGLKELIGGLEGAEKLYKSIVTGNLMALGGRIVYFCQRELQDVKYTGKLERSLSSHVDASGPRLTVGPTAPHSIFVRMGTRPHWAPIAPLKRWAKWKLGDESAAYPVQKSIAKHGTSMYQQRKRGTKSNPWPLRVVERGDFKTALTATGKRIGENLAAVVTGEYHAGH
jgi:hypothetical protein